MPTIDLARLRRFHSNAELAHAASREAGLKARQAAQDLRAAEDEKERCERGRHGAVRSEDAARIFASEDARHSAAISAARQVLATAKSAQASASEIANHAGRLRTVVREYATAHGALPDDLKDI